MNEKSLRTLSLLINSPRQYFSYEELARYLSVSTRSVRYYMQAIRDYLRAKGLGRELLSFTDGGCAFVGSANEGRRICLSLSQDGFYTYRLSPQERSWLILLFLSLSDSWIRLSDLTQRFHASRATVVTYSHHLEKIIHWMIFS